MTTPQMEAIEAEERRLADKAPTPTGRSMMTMKDKFRLMELVRDEYASRGQSDNDFAAYARVKLAFYCTGNNVAGCRDAFGIPSSREVAAMQNPDMLVKRVEELERVVAHIKHNLGL